MGKANEMLLAAEKMREVGNDPRKSLAMLPGVRQQAEVEGDVRTQVHCNCTEALAWKHIFQISRDEADFVRFLVAGKTMMREAEHAKLPDKIATANFIVGSTFLERKRWDEAILYLEEAVVNCPEHPAERGDWRRHLGQALYLSGRKREGYEMLWQGMREIEVNAEALGDSYKIDVWLSGGYMAATRMRWTDDNAEAKNCLKLAEAIIQNNPALRDGPRGRQFLELKKELGIA